MVWDFAFGKACDHRVMEEVSLASEGGRITIHLRGQLDPVMPSLRLWQNGVDISSTVTFTLSLTNDRVVYVADAGSVVPLAGTAYPLPDYELGYFVPPDMCPKCFRRVA